MIICQNKYSLCFSNFSNIYGNVTCSSLKQTFNNSKANTICLTSRKSIKFVCKNFTQLRNSLVYSDSIPFDTAFAQHLEKWARLIVPT